MSSGGAVVAEAEDAVPLHADGPVVDLARQDVHDTGVPEDEVGRDGAPCRCDEVAEGQGPGTLRRLRDSVRQRPRVAIDWTKGGAD